MHTPHVHHSPQCDSSIWGAARNSSTGTGLVGLREPSFRWAAASALRSSGVAPNRFAACAPFHAEADDFAFPDDGGDACSLARDNGVAVLEFGGGRAIQLLEGPLTSSLLRVRQHGTITRVDFSSKYRR
jgi:hypothetical protein